MSTKIKLIHWGIFLVLSILWWFIAPSIAYPLNIADSLGVKFLIWALFCAIGIVVTREE